MGVIKRQGFKQSIVSFVGAGIGILSYLFIYPLALEAYGLVQYLTSLALVTASFITLGSSSIAIRFFPTFKNESAHSGFLSFLLLFPTIGFLLFLLFASLFETTILSFFSDKGEFYLNYIPYVIPITFFAAFTSLFVAYTSNFHRIVIPSILRELLPKIVLPILILLLFMRYINTSTVIKVITLMYLVITLGLIVYLRYLKQLKLKVNRSFFTKALLKKVFNYGGYSILGGLGFTLANQIDIVMVGSLMELKSTAVFTIALFMGNVIDIPRKAINNISSPIISDAWKRNDLKQIYDLYKKSAINQLIFGLWVFLGVWCSIDYLFMLMQNTDIVKTGKYVVLIIGMTRLLDMMTGVNNLVIGHSKYFRFNFYAILILAVLNIINNLIFIPWLGINGAALATFISMLLYNSMKFGFLQYKLKMNPFTKDLFIVILIGILTYLLVAYIPSVGNEKWHVLIDIAIRSILVTTLFLGSVVFFKLSRDVNEMIDTFLQKALKFIKRES